MFPGEHLEPGAFILVGKHVGSDVIEKVEGIVADKSFFYDVCRIGYLRCYGNSKSLGVLNRIARITIGREFSEIDEKVCLISGSTGSGN